MSKDKNIERMKKCPRFKRCSVPICPLDADKDIRVYLTGEPKCTLSKNRRLELGKDLPWKGMTRREYSGWKRWQESGPPKGFKKNMGRLGKDSKKIVLCPIFK